MFKLNPHFGYLKTWTLKQTYSDIGIGVGVIHKRHFKSMLIKTSGRHTTVHEMRSATLFSNAAKHGERRIFMYLDCIVRCLKNEWLKNE